MKRSASPGEWTGASGSIGAMTGTINRGLAALLQLAAAIGLHAAAAAGQAADDAFGTWKHPENDSQIEIYPCRGGLCARIVATSDAQKFDHKNPDPDLRRRPILGLVIVNGATQSGEAQWTGALYNRADGQFYDGHLRVVSRSRLELTGCTMVVLCRTVTWQRIK